MSRCKMTAQKKTVPKKTETGCLIHLLKELGKEREMGNIET